MTQEAARFAALGLDRDRDERRRDLFARRSKGVELARIGQGRELVREAEEAVGLASHRADDEHDFVSRRLGAEGARRDVLHPLEGANGGAAVLLDDESHGPHPLLLTHRSVKMHDHAQVERAATGLRRTPRAPTARSDPGAGPPAS